MTACDNEIINSKELSTTTSIEKKAEDEILSLVDAKTKLLLNMLI